jgi:hypothetical protein
VSKKAKVEGTHVESKLKQPPDWDAILGGVGSLDDTKSKAVAASKAAAPAGVRADSNVPKPKASSQRADAKAVNDAKKEQPLKVELAAMLLPETQESGRGSGRAPVGLVAPKVDTGARKRPTSATRPATSVEEDVPKRQRHYEAEQVLLHLMASACVHV